MSVENGDKVLDKISGFEGIVTGTTIYLNGCVRFIIQPKIDKDGKMPGPEWIDEEQLEVLEKGAFKKEEVVISISEKPDSIPIPVVRKTGGPNPIPIDRSIPEER